MDCNRQRTVCVLGGIMSKAQSGVERTSQRRESLFAPIAVGVALTAVFYVVISRFPFQREFLQRYFCSHPLEYVTSVLFFVALAILGRKLTWLVSEKQALSRIGGLCPVVPGDVSESEWLPPLPSSLRNTLLSRRIADAQAFVRTKVNGTGLEEHLKYLAEMASERLHESYALVRTITWAIPILGFLGTVIGITIAVANVTPEQLDTSLGEVTSGLAVAFDTTALALALSILLVFAADLLKRSEQSVLVQVEEFGINHLVVLARSDPRLDPGSSFVNAETQATAMLLTRTEELIHRQTKLWNDGLQAMRERWLQSIDGQTNELQAGIRQVLETTLAVHAEQLQQTRTEFAETIRCSLDEFVNRIDGLAEDSSARVDRWQQALLTSSTSTAEVLEQSRNQSERLADLIEHSEHLGRIEIRLSENLAAVRAAETFEDALHNLTAAVHMLTARSRPQAA